MFTIRYLASVGLAVTLAGCGGDSDTEKARQNSEAVEVNQNSDAVALRSGNLKTAVFCGSGSDGVEVFITNNLNLSVPLLKGSLLDAGRFLYSEDSDWTVKTFNNIGMIIVPVKGNQYRPEGIVLIDESAIEENVDSFETDGYPSTRAQYLNTWDLNRPYPFSTYAVPPFYLARDLSSFQALTYELRTEYEEEPSPLIISQESSTGAYEGCSLIENPEIGIVQDRLQLFSDRMRPVWEAIQQKESARGSSNLI